MSAEVLNDTVTVYPYVSGMNESDLDPGMGVGSGTPDTTYPTLTPSSENTSDCNLLESPFDSLGFKIVAILRASVGLFSFLCCIGVVLVILFCRKYHFFRQRLILYFAVATMLHSLAYAVGRVEFRSQRPIEDDYCYFAGYFETLTAWMELLSIFCLTFNLFGVTVRKKKIRIYGKNLEGVYLVVTFVLPFFWCWIPFLFHSYGSSGPWCGIRSTRENCQIFHLGIALRFIVWQVPFYAIFLVILVASIVIAIKVRRDVHVWEGTIDPQAQARKQEIKKEVKPLLWYPIVYLVLKTSLLISHIYDAARPHSPAVSVWLLQALSTPLAGALIALVYTMDRETRNRMKPSLVKASCKGLCCAMCRKGSGVKDYAVNPLEFGDSLGDVRYYEVMDRIDDRHQSTTAVATCRL